MKILLNRNNWFNHRSDAKYSLEERKISNLNDDELQLSPEDLDFRVFEDTEYERIEDK